MKTATLFMCIMWSISACATNLYPVIPQPNKMVSQKGEFVINANTTIHIVKGTEALRAEAAYFTELVEPATGYILKTAPALAKKNVIVFSIDPRVTNAEGYSLKVSPDKIEVKCQTPAGAFYAIQTLRQLLPPEIEQKTKAAGIKWAIPAVEIEDAPRFAYRGLMLDVGRYFFTMDFVKRYIDLMAMYKYNTFHLHLTEDQGWRIEIKKYPKLTEIGAWRKQSIVGHKKDKPRKYDGVPHGGFYTQAELRDLVKYAAERHITIIPEIEMPGHSQAALAAYPYLGCVSDTTYEVSCDWGVHKDVYCPKEETFRFLEDVLTEVMDIFPGKYIHIGGDECVKERWKKSVFCQDLIKKHNLENEEGLQSYFIHRIDSFVTSKRRTIIGWDEILEGGLSPNATVMAWRGEKGGITAARQKHEVIMSPDNYCYLDYYQSRDISKEPLAIKGFLTLDTTYTYNPTSGVLSPEDKGYIIGVQGNLWTEYISNPGKADYMTYPRACAISEVGWTNTEGKNYDDFLVRLKVHSKHLEQLGINFAKHFLK